MSAVVRIRRLLRLVELLQSGRSYNSNELSELCGVSRRTIFRDLNTLQSSGLGVIFDEQRQGYSLPTRLFLPPTDFTLKEALSLLVLCHELGDERAGIPFHDAARSAAIKLLSSLPAHLRELIGELTQSISVRIEPRNPLAGSKPIFELLTKAITGRKKVRIRYHSLVEGEGNISTLLSPYRILFMRRSWYVIGRSSLHRSVRTFNVGRISSAEMVAEGYRVPPRFNLDRYLGNAWALIRERGQQFQVVVRFSKKVAHNVAEVHWHKTQKLAWNDDGTLDFTATVDGLGEIIWWILGYGDEAEVLEPPALRHEVMRRIESMRRVYSAGASPPRPSIRRTKTVRRKHN